MRISKIHAEKRAAYEAAEPKRFGTLHERVKFLATLASDVFDQHEQVLRANPKLEEMRQAVFDVEREAALNDCDAKSRAAGRRKEFINHCNEY